MAGLLPQRVGGVSRLVAVPEGVGGGYGRAPSGWTRVTNGTAPDAHARSGCGWGRALGRSKATPRRREHGAAGDVTGGARGQT